jgi:transcriptional regulator with XRE-family HTH domain
MTTQRTTRPRWPKGAWMTLTSANALRELMIKKGLSYADLGRSAGVSKGFISHLVKQRRKTCTPLVAYRIAERLDVPLSVLFVPSLPTSASGSANQNRKAA